MLLLMRVVDVCVGLWLPFSSVIGIGLGLGGGLFVSCLGWGVMGEGVSVLWPGLCLLH